MSVPFYNFQDLHHEKFRAEVKERISNIIDNNTFVEGEYNASFEKRFAELQGSKHCLLVANGTDAIEISLECHGIGPGDLVGVPGITFYATAEAVLNRGATPVFIDVEPESGLMCAKSVARVSETKDLKAIIPVHIYGLPADIPALEEVCTPKNIAIIEDAAQAQGTFLASGPVGTSKNLTTFSFYPTKNLSAFGDAGCILTNDDEMAKKIINIRNHGRGETAGLGRNSRCDHIQAAVLDLKLDSTPELNEKRKTVASWYHQKLQGLPVQIQNEKYLKTSSWHLYPIQLPSVEARQKLQSLFADKKTGCVAFYERALCDEKGLTEFSGESENAKKFAGHTLCLPMNPFLTEQDVDTVCNQIKEFCSTL
jgi:dTDP-4-amino-4,6-dideoxygalactose transaminase